jgi:hypothetical protein
MKVKRAQSSYEGTWGRVVIALFILNLGKRWAVCVYVCVCVFNFKTRLLYPLGKAIPVRIELDAGWAPEPIWTLWRRDKTRSNQPYVQPVSCSISLRTTLSRLAPPSDVQTPNSLVRDSAWYTPLVLRVLPNYFFNITTHAHTTYF